VEAFFARFVEFSKELNTEERRSLAENLDEEQLAIFDLLTRPGPPLTDNERRQVKRVAESLLGLLEGEKLVLDWRKQQQARAAVRLAVETTLDELPQSYGPDIYREKCYVVCLHVFDSYFDDGGSVYAEERRAA